MTTPASRRVTFTLTEAPTALPALPARLTVPFKSMLSLSPVTHTSL